MAECFILWAHKKRSSAARLMSVFLETANIQQLISTAIVNYVHRKLSCWRYAGASTWQFCGRLYIAGFNTAVFTDPQHRASLDRAWEREKERLAVKGRRLFRQPCWSRTLSDWQTRARGSAWRPRVIAVPVLHVCHICMPSCHSVCCSVNFVSLYAERPAAVIE